MSAVAAGDRGAAADGTRPHDPDVAPHGAARRVRAAISRSRVRRTSSLRREYPTAAPPGRPGVGAVLRRDGLRAPGLGPGGQSALLARSRSTSSPRRRKAKSSRGCSSRDSRTSTSTCARSRRRGGWNGVFMSDNRGRRGFRDLHRQARTRRRSIARSRSVEMVLERRHASHRRCRRQLRRLQLRSDLCQSEPGRRCSPAAGRRRATAKCRLPNCAHAPTRSARRDNLLTTSSSRSTRSSRYPRHAWCSA